VYQGGDEFIIWAQEAYGLPRRGFVTPPNYLVEINSFSLGSNYFLDVTRFYGWFRDDEGNTHESDINLIAQEAITIGCNPADLLLYCPRNGATRIQLAVFIGRMIGITPVSNPTVKTFQDIPLTWLQPEWSKLSTTRGSSKPAKHQEQERWYYPKRTSTRLDVATFLQRALDLPLFHRTRNLH